LWHRRCVRLMATAPDPGRLPFVDAEHPEPPPCLASLGLQRRQCRIPVVLRVYPGGAAADQFGIDVEPVRPDLTDAAAIAVGVLRNYPRLLAEA
jgi:hypothetical protein